MISYITDSYNNDWGLSNCSLLHLLLRCNFPHLNRKWGFYMFYFLYLYRHSARRMMIWFIFSTEDFSCMCQIELIIVWFTLNSRKENRPPLIEKNKHKLNQRQQDYNHSSKKHKTMSSYPSKSLLSWSQKAWMLLQSVSLLSGFVALSEMSANVMSGKKTWLYQNVVNVV